MLHGTDPFVPDGDLDPDGDSLNNRSEWMAGTNPQDAGSFLQLHATANGAGTVTLSFEAMANRSYTLLSNTGFVLRSASCTVWHCRLEAATRRSRRKQPSVNS